jgi:hypothetical protein
MLDADVTGARFEADGRLTVQVRIVGSRRVVKVHLAEPSPVKTLATIADANITLDENTAYEGKFTWPLDASKRARELGRVVVIFEPDEGEPVGIGFDFAPAPRPKKRPWTVLVPLALVVIGVLLAVISRAC